MNYRIVRNLGSTCTGKTLVEITPGASSSCSCGHGCSCSTSCCY